MKRRLVKLLFTASVVANLFVTLPAILILIASTDIRLVAHKHLQLKLGRRDIVFIGDSITHGGGVWGLRIGRNPLNVWNYGHGGLTTRQLQFYATKVAREHGFRHAFVMAGANDEDRTIDGARASFGDYRLIIDTLLSAGVTPIIQLTLFREKEPSPAFIINLNQRLRNYAIQRGLKVIDLNPILAPNQTLLPQYTTDGLHLSEPAYALWAERVRAVLSETE